MRKLIATKLEHCVGCNRCMRECPIEMANLTFQDEDGNIKVKIDNTKCIACGACLSVCKHGSRYFADDTQAFFDDLKAGVPISLITAPSMKVSLPDWRRILTLLRGLGVRAVYDVSFGADINIWAHVRYYERHDKPLIMQPCPAIVSYSEIHRHELLENLSPIHSPMGCTSIYMRKYAGVTGRIAALSPCIAKANEFEAIDTIQYNVVFSRLSEYLEEHSIALPEEESDFDHPEAGLGTLFSTPGGLTENLRYFMGDAPRIDKSEGRDVYRQLDDYAKTPPELLPQVFDVLSCAEGCNVGSGCSKGRNIFQIQDAMTASRQAVVSTRSRADFKRIYREYDSAFQLSDFFRRYTPLNTVQIEVTEAQIQQAFRLLDKDTYAKQNYNCGACGSDTCRGMAHKIAMGLNIPLNCIVKSRDDTRDEHQKNIELYQKNQRYIELIHYIGEHLLFTRDDNHTERVLDAMTELQHALAAANLCIWKRQDDEDGKVAAYTLYEGAFEASPITYMHEDQMPEIVQVLLKGAPVHVKKSACVEEMLFLFQGFDYQSVLIVPILIKGSFWGAVVLDLNDEHDFAEEDLSVIVACGLLIVSSIVEQEMTQSLVYAREEALAGTRAKSDFLSRMSHEMRTPMNAIIGMTQIAEKTDDPAKIRYCLSTINDSSSQLLGLINDVLDMAKIEAGKLELDYAPFSLEETLAKLCNFVSAKIQEKQLRLQLEMDYSMHMHYVGDELRISQALTNLLSNAVKFTPEHGSICLAVQVLNHGQERSALRFSVADTGIGMTKEQVGRLFHAFEQADSTITKRFGGTGLGLAISQNIVEAMGGSIQVQSEPQKGSTFSFTLELEHAFPSGAQAQREREHCKTVQLLAVDGDAQSLEQFRAIAELLEIPCTPAATGAEAVAAVRRRAKPFDAVFIGAEPPDMGIAGLLEQLSVEVDRSRVVMMAPLSEWNIENESLSRYIAKPLFPSTLLQTVYQVTSHTAAPPIGAGARQDFSGVTLLLAEDIEINREIFKALLEETGITIDTAPDGLAAVRKFTDAPRRYDLIVMDIQMPEMDGYEATRAIRALDAPEAETVPIIAMTANAFKDDIERCLACGMNDHLPKPIDAGILIDKIAEYTRRNKKEAANAGATLPMGEA